MNTLSDLRSRYDNIRKKLLTSNTEEEINKLYEELDLILIEIVSIIDRPPSDNK